MLTRHTLKYKIAGLHSQVERLKHTTASEQNYLQDTLSKFFKKQNPEEFTQQAKAESHYSHLEWLIHNRIKDIQSFPLSDQPLKSYEEFAQYERVYVDLIDTHQYLKQHLTPLTSDQDILNLKDHLPLLKSTLDTIEKLLELSINWQQIQSLLNDHLKQVERAGRNLATSFALEHVVLEEMEQQLERLSLSTLSISECIDLLNDKDIDTSELSAQYFDLMNHLMYLQEQLNEQYELSIPESIF